MLDDVRQCLLHGGRRERAPRSDGAWPVEEQPRHLDAGLSLSRLSRFASASPVCSIKTRANRRRPARRSGRAPRARGSASWWQSTVRLPRAGRARPAPASRWRRAVPGRRRRRRTRPAGRAVLLLVVDGERLDESGRGSAPRQKADGQVLDRDLGSIEHRPRRRSRHTSGGAVNVDLTRRTGMSPASVVTTVLSILRTRLARTTCSIERSAAISRRLMVAPRNASGSTNGSMRTKTSASSSRRAKSTPSVAASQAATHRACSCMNEPTNSSGCVSARSNCHGSRPRIHRVRSGSTPSSRSQTHVSTRSSRPRRS